MAALAAFLFVIAGASGPASAAGVDLAVITPDITFSNTNPVDGQNLTILVIVRNFGDTNATQVLVTAVETGSSTLIGQATIDQIDAQSQAQAGISWDVTGVGDKSVTISVSAAEVDSNPDNNVAVSESITVRARPDLTIDGVTFDNPTPPAFSSSVEIRVWVGNTGGSNASTVILALYDGDPAEGASEIHRATVVLVPTPGPVLVTYTWSIVDKGGRHDIYAVVLSSMPAESPEGMANNWGKGTLLVLTQYDIEITTTREITYDPQLNGFLIVRSGGDLTLRDCTFTILQERDNQFDIIVESGGRLSLVGATVDSENSFGLTLRDGGEFEMSAGSTFGGTMASDGGVATVSNSTIEGGIVGSYAELHLEVVNVVGDVSLSNTVAFWMDVNLGGPSPVELSNVTLDATHVLIPNAQPSSIIATDGTIATLRDLVAGPVETSPGTSLALWRQVNLLVRDFTGIPIRGASVVVTFALSLAHADTVVSGTDGRVSLWLLTDLLAGGSPQYVGSYLFDASYLTYDGQSAANLPNYPTLSADSNRVDVSVVFPVINPADLFPPMDGDRLVAAGTSWTVGHFTQDGNLRIAGIVNVGGGVFSLDQERDFEKAIILPSGTLNLTGATLTSDYRFNIYLFNASKLTATGSTIRANAVVVFDSASVSITGGSTLDANIIMPGGSSLTLGEGVTATGSNFWVRGGPSIVLQGATLSVDKVDIATTADISLNGTVLQFVGTASLIGQSSTSTLSMIDSRLVGGTVAMEAGNIAIEGTEFAVGAITRLWASTVMLDATTVHGSVMGIKPGSTGTFTDVETVSLTVEPTAIVNVFHTLSFAVLDINGNAVTSGSFAIREMPNGTTDVVTGDLAQLVTRSLHAATIRGGVEVFEGNYRLTIDMDGGETTVVYVVMDTPKAVTFNLPEEIVLPNLVSISVASNITELARNESLTVTGNVWLVYAGRGSPLLPRTPMTLTLVAGATTLGTVTTLPDGSFNWTGQLTVPEGVTGPMELKVSGSYLGVTGQGIVNIIVLEPDPTSLILSVDIVRFEKRQNEDFTISGIVKYGNEKPAPNVKIRVFFTIPPQAQEYVDTTDDSGLWSVSIPGRRTASTYQISVAAIDEQYNLFSQTQQVTVTVINAQGDTGSDLGELTLPILAIVAAAAAGIIGFLLLNAKRRSVNYVECGNCGRPVHEGESKCPSCGVEFEEDIAKCSHCASWIPADATRCPKCNTEFKPVDDAIASPSGDVAGAAPEAVRAEVTTPNEPVKAMKQPVAVKKKVLKRTPEGGEGGEDADPFGGEGQTEQQAPAPTAPKPAEKKPEEKKEKGLFDDL